MLNTMPGRATEPDIDRLLAYAADLELEVDRLRRHGAFIEREATTNLLRILRLCTAPAPGAPLPTLGEGESTARALLDVVKDLHDLPGYHPAHDQVIAIAVRPLALQVCSAGGGCSSPAASSCGWNWRRTTSSGSRPGCGTSSTTWRGTDLVLTLPRYDLLDYLE